MTHESQAVVCRVKNTHTRGRYLVDVTPLGRYHCCRGKGEKAGGRPRSESTEHTVGVEQGKIGFGGKKCECSQGFRPCYTDT